jgi:hypothetical protein
MRSRGIDLPIHDHGTRRGWGVSVIPRPLFTPGKDTVPIVQAAGWTPGPVWTGAENLASTGIWSLNRPARSQSLHRLSCVLYNYKFSSFVYYSENVIQNCNYVQDTHQLNKMIVCVLRNLFKAGLNNFISFERLFILRGRLLNNLMHEK